MSTLDHVTLVVIDCARSRAFYEKALAPLGITRIVEFGQACGFGFGAFVLDPDGHDVEAVFHGGA
jgi:catechol 2,3-dioxygenase-like lactoylglutathione lyase family enzyme